MIQITPRVTLEYRNYKSCTFWLVLIRLHSCSRVVLLSWVGLPSSATPSTAILVWTGIHQMPEISKSYKTKDRYLDTSNVISQAGHAEFLWRTLDLSVYLGQSSSRIGPYL